MVTNLFLSIFAISISISPVIIFLLLFTPFLNKRYAVKWKYLMWIVIAVRLTIPFHMNIPFPQVLIHVPEQITAPVETNHENNTGTILPIQSDNKPIDGNHGNAAKILPQTGQKPLKLTLLDLIAYLWLTGCLFFLSVHICSFLHYKRQIHKKGIVVEEEHILRQVCILSGELQMKPNVRILRYKEAESPMVIGFLKPVLVLPDCDYSRKELRFVLKHELVHVKRHDIYCKLFFVIANALHWFNPLIYMMQKEAVIDMELSCDEKVIQQTAYAERKAYTETLFSTFSRQHKKGTVLTTQFYGGKKIMKRRFKNILTGSPKKNGLFLCICAVSITLISGMLVGCSTMKTDSSEEPAQTDSEAGNVAARNPAAIQADASDDNDAEMRKESEPGKDTDMQTDPAQETTFETMAYIKGIEEGSISFDRVEWVEVPGDRAEELGITEDDAPGGFSVYNQEEAVEKYVLSSVCEINVLDWENSYQPMEMSSDDFFKLLEERGGQNEWIPYTILVENGEITQIEEHYVP